MNGPWLVLAAIVAVAAMYVMLPVAAEVFVRYRAKRELRCPETGADARVGVDARSAALTATFRQPRLQVENCSLWPEREGCAQRCLGLVDDRRAPLPNG